MSSAASRIATPVRIGEQGDRNSGLPLDLSEVLRLRVNRSAVERRAATLVTRRTVKKDWQAAWLLKAITTIDLTTLQGDDTPGNVRRLCAKARQPVRQDLLERAWDGRAPDPRRAPCASIRASSRSRSRRCRAPAFPWPPCPPASPPGRSPST